MGPGLGESQSHRGFSSVHDTEHHRLNLGRNPLARMAALCRGEGARWRGREKTGLQALSAEKPVLWNSRSQPAIRGFQCRTRTCLSAQVHLSAGDLLGDMAISLKVLG